VIPAEQQLTLRQVKALVGGRSPGKTIANATLHRWYTTGVRGVRLQVERHGGLIVTSREWLDRFFAELNARREESLQGVPA
jgi:hypothetical protein